MNFVRTVCGDIAPGELGATHVHEHLLCAPPLLAADEPDLVLDDEERSARELSLFAQAGGSAVVDLTCEEYGRDVQGLRRLSQRSGIHIVAATGHIMEGYWDGVVDIGARSDAALVDEMVTALTGGGLDGTGIRAGVIKVGTSQDRVTHDECRMLEAAAVAQRATGAPISTHTTAGTMAVEQVEILRAAGADMDHVIIGHLDRRLDWDTHLTVARSGAYLGYDCVSKEQYQPDALRIEFIQRLAADGYGRRICLSGDLARRSYLASYGGRPGLADILTRFVPQLLDAGVEHPLVDDLMVTNPARLLAWRA